MSQQDRPSPKATSRDERLAKALRDNLGRRKALARAKRQREGDDPMPSESQKPESKDSAARG